jgi:hypothetical protein
MDGEARDVTSGRAKLNKRTSPLLGLPCSGHVYPCVKVEGKGIAARVGTGSRVEDGEWALKEAFLGYVKGL